MKKWRDHIFLFLSTKYLGRSFLSLGAGAVVILVFFYILFLGHVDRQERDLRLGILIPQEYLYFEQSKACIETLLQTSNDEEQAEILLEKLQHWYTNLIFVSLKIQASLEEETIAIDAGLVERRLALIDAFERYVERVQGMDVKALAENRFALQLEGDQFNNLSSSYGDLIEISSEIISIQVEEMRAGHLQFFMLILVFLGLMITCLYLPMARRLQQEYDKSVLSEKYYRKQAYYDEVAQVGNRRYALEVLNELVGRPNSSFVCAYIDLDNFKPVNDNFGHDMGDWCLQTFGNIFKRRLRRYDCIARIGGDEFVVIFGTGSTAGIEQMLDKVRLEFEKVCYGRLQEHAPSFSYGLALFPYDGRDPEQLLKVADQNMYDLKKAKKNL